MITLKVQVPPMFLEELDRVYFSFINVFILCPNSRLPPSPTTYPAPLPSLLPFFSASTSPDKSSYAGLGASSLFDDDKAVQLEGQDPQVKLLWYPYEDQSVHLPQIYSEPRLSTRQLFWLVVQSLGTHKVPG